MMTWLYSWEGGHFTGVGQSLQRLTLLPLWPPEFSFLLCGPLGYLMPSCKPFSDVSQLPPSYLTTRT